MSIPPPSSSARETRLRWIHLIQTIAHPPLAALAAGRLREQMPVEAAAGHAESRAQVTYLEALGRTLAGLAPWLELDGVPDPAEAAARTTLRDLARGALAQAVDPGSPDLLNFTEGSQPLVDAAFLAHALLRAPQALFFALPEITRDRLLSALRSTRSITPGFNNWLLFSAMIEAALLRFTGEADLMRIDYAVRQHGQWYKGDGVYGDGPDFHWDYYNSFVIQPMLLDVLAEAAKHTARWQEWTPLAENRARRHAAVLERLIAPDGSFPPLGRSLAYRCGAFHHLAQMALHHDLPAGLAPAQVRCALDAVIRRTLEAPGTFDAQGWLRIGLAGAQPDLGENYISTGSLYLCSTAFLPLGLPPEDPFWSAPDEPWTSVRIWRGDNHPADHALY
jgi:hypothetical protein